MKPDPSYSALLDARIKLWQPGSNAAPPVMAEFTRLREMDVKEQAYRAMARQNIACVNYHVYPDVETAVTSFLPRQFVLKPARGHSSYGVYLIQKRANGTLYCRMHKRKFDTITALAQEYTRRLGNSRNGTMSKEVIIEEYVRDSFGFDVPLDYKVYAFATGTPFVMQRYAPTYLPKEQWAFAFYDQDGRDLGPIRERVGPNPDVALTPPDTLEQIFATANKIVQNMQVSFARIDLYTTRKRVLFGEMTPLPNIGKEAYVPEYDQILGQHWQDSLDHLGISYDAALG